jgi:hypothetical protein
MLPAAHAGTCDPIDVRGTRENFVCTSTYFTGRCGNSTSCTFESLRDTELETTPNIGGAKKLLKPRQA